MERAMSQAVKQAVKHATRQAAKFDAGRGCETALNGGT